MTKVPIGYEKFQKNHTSSGHLPSSQQEQEDQEPDATPSSSQHQLHHTIRVIQKQGSSSSIKSHGSSRSSSNKKKKKSTVNKKSESAYASKSVVGTSSSSSSFGKKKKISSNHNNSNKNSTSSHNIHKDVVHIVDTTNTNSSTIPSDEAAQEDDTSYDSDDIRTDDCGSPFSSGGRRTPQSISNIVKTAAEVTQQFYKIGAAELQNLGLCGVAAPNANNTNNNSNNSNHNNNYHNHSSSSHHQSRTTAVEEEKEFSPYPLRQSYSSPVRCVSDDPNNRPVTLMMRRSISTPVTSLGGGSSAFRKPSAYYSLDNNKHPINKKTVESSLSAKAVKNIKDKRRARRVKNNNNNYNKATTSATITAKTTATTTTTAYKHNETGDDSSSSCKPPQEATANNNTTTTDTSLDLSSNSSLLNISKLTTTSDEGSSLDEPAHMLRTTMTMGSSPSTSTSTITSSSPTNKALPKGFAKTTIPPSPTITRKDAATISSTTNSPKEEREATAAAADVHFEEEESVGGESSHESGYQKFEDELLTSNNKSTKSSTTTTAPSGGMTTHHHHNSNRTQNVASPVTYQHFVEEDEQLPSPILARNPVVATFHPRSTPPHNRKLSSPRFFMENTSPARTTNSNNTSNQSSCGERSFTSSIEADREVMEMNRRERRRREADLLDGVHSVHSSDTASTNTQAYRALVTSSSNSIPREGACMPVDSIFAMSNNNANNTTTSLLGRPPPSNHHNNRSPITVSSNYSSLANNTISSQSMGEEPPRFVSYPERKSSNVKSSSRTTSSSSKDNSSIDEEMMEYSKLGSGSGLISPVNEDNNKQRKKKNIDVRKYHNMSSRTAKPPMNSSPIKSDAYDNFYRSSKSKIITDGTRTPTPPPTNHYNFVMTPNSSDYLSHLSPPSQILESPLETQELQRRGAARPNFLPSSDKISNYGQDKMLLISPDYAAASSCHIIPFPDNNNDDIRQPPPYPAETAVVTPEKI